MSTFTTPLQVELIGKWQFKLLTPFEYHVGKFPSTEIIRVPQDFITNFASIPRFLWSILSPIDEYAKAAVVHDWLYFKGIYSKRVTELIFNEAMKVLKTPTWKRRCVYSGVYYGGHYTWNKYRRAERKSQKI